MKKTLLSAVLCACALAFASCSDDEPKGQDADHPTVSEGAFVLSQGVYGYQIEGGLDLIDYNASSSQRNLFQKANGKSLGATPQGAVVYGSKAYIAVYESNVIQIVDRNTCKQVKMISLENEEGKGPRALVAKEGKVYISMFNGYVSRLDTLTMAIDKNVKVGPNPEIMAIHGNYLYVPNSDGLNYLTGLYGTTASKIDLAKFEVVNTFEVGLNPGQFASNGHDLFVLCKGNYDDVPSRIYRVVNDVCEKEPLVEATLMDIKGNKLYYVNAPWDATEHEYGVYDIRTKAKVKMLADAGVDSPAAIAVDPIAGNIVITSYSMNNGYVDYMTDGYAKVYDANGSFLKRYDVGVGPCCIFFNYK